MPCGRWLSVDRNGLDWRFTPTPWSMVEKELEPLAALYSAEPKSRMVAAFAVGGSASAIAEKTHAATNFLVVLLVTFSR